MLGRNYKKSGKSSAHTDTYMRKLTASVISLAVTLPLLAAAGCGGIAKTAEPTETSDESKPTETTDESKPTETTEPSVTVATVSDSGMSMKYAVFGSGEKNFVILPGLSVHRVTESAAAIANAYGEIAKEYTVYVFDRAENMPDGYTVEDIARDTAAAMKALGIEKADIFGASQGGMIALTLAADFPEAVGSLILCSTAARCSDTLLAAVDEWIKYAKEKDQLKLLESFAEKVYSDATVKAYRDVLVSAEPAITDEEYRRFIVSAEACKTFDCLDRLSSVKCPALVIGSEGDRVMTADTSKQTADALGCEIYLYGEEYGHAVYDEAADCITRYLDFLHKQEMR